MTFTVCIDDVPLLSNVVGPTLKVIRVDFCGFYKRPLQLDSEEVDSLHFTYGELDYTRFIMSAKEMK